MSMRMTLCNNVFISLFKLDLLLLDIHKGTIPLKHPS